MENDFLNAVLLSSDDNSDPSTKSLADKAYECIKRNIYNGTLPLNEPVSQAYFAEMCNVSRTPLREAIRKLEHEGLVVIKPNKRIYIPALTAEEIDQMVASRMLVQSAAFLASFPYLNDEDFDFMQARLDDMSDCIKNDDLEGSRKAHKFFHDEMFKYAGPYLRKLQQYFVEQSKRYRSIYYQAYSFDEVKLNEHRLILKACRENRAGDAVEMLNTHTATVGMITLAFVDPLYECVNLRSMLKMFKSLDTTDIVSLKKI